MEVKAFEMYLEIVSYKRSSAVMFVRFQIAAKSKAKPYLSQWWFLSAMLRLSISDREVFVALQKFSPTSLSLLFICSSATLSVSAAVFFSSLLFFSFLSSGVCGGAGAVTC